MWDAGNGDTGAIAAGGTIIPTRSLAFFWRFWRFEACGCGPWIGGDIVGRRRSPVVPSSRKGSWAIMLFFTAKSKLFYQLYIETKCLYYDSSSLTLNQRLCWKSVNGVKFQNFAARTKNRHLVQRGRHAHTTTVLIILHAPLSVLGYKTLTPNVAPTIYECVPLSIFAVSTNVAPTASTWHNVAGYSWWFCFFLFLASL